MDRLARGRTTDSELQNRCGGACAFLGGFDSHALPPGISQESPLRRAFRFLPLRGIPTEVGIVLAGPSSANGLLTRPQTTICRRPRRSPSLWTRGCRPAQEVVQRRGGRLLEGRADVGVCLEGDPYRGVPEPLAHHLWVDASGEPQRRRGVPQVVEPDPRRPPLERRSVRRPGGSASSRWASRRPPETPGHPPARPCRGRASPRPGPHGAGQAARRHRRRGPPAGGSRPSWAP